MTLWSRAIREHRALLISLVIAAVLNMLAYLFVVQPLTARSAGAAGRAAAAGASLQSAQREFDAAKQLVDGKARADQELDAFYGKILPADLTAARRMTYTSLPALAKRANVRYETRRFDTPDPERDARLARLGIRMTLQGEYEDIRAFIYELERAPEFVIIDDVTLTEGDENAPLTLRLDLSTYFNLRTDER
jgi:Tfp pilus assembly protein PilO